MEITYDLAKNAKNIVERNLPFSRVADFQWNTASFREDERKAYPERRFIAIGYWKIVCMCCAFRKLSRVFG